ncbi:MAG: MFS transporter [Pseudomonadota bacterium]
MTTETETYDTPYAWRRLLLSLIYATAGGVGLWSSPVIFPTLQAEFGLDRGAASFTYTATLAGFAIGGLIMGPIVDRIGMFRPLVLGAMAIAAGYILTSFAGSYWQFLLGQAVLIGMIGSAVTLGPLVADVSLWFRRRRGIAVAIAASGNYFAGAIWPPFIQAGIAEFGWRTTHIGVGLICLAIMIPIAFALRRRPAFSLEAPVPMPSLRRLPPVAPGTLQAILVFAGIACCVAMAMPQVHIVAYCMDLGYGAAVGAEMLSIMLALGVLSRVASGWLADRIGGAGTLLLGSGLQAVALVLFVPFDGLASLYALAAFFGLVQGGIVPSYALIVRDCFPAKEAGKRVTLVLTATVVGMAIGGWLAGEIFDATGSYQLAFLNGFAVNALHFAIALWLYLSMRGRPKASAEATPA